MEWVDRMNRAIDAIEEGLLGPLDTGKIARVMACSFDVFQRYFVQIAGVSVSEYARRRRLTLAAYDVLHTGMRILDIAVKYGYDSADAFTAAFKRAHGITPTAARAEGTNLIFYTRLHFTVKITGVREMHYRKIEKDPFDVIGVRMITPYGGGTWGVVKDDGRDKQLTALGGEGSALLGMCYGFQDDGSDDYMVALEYEGTENHGFQRESVPGSAWLIFDAVGPISENTLGAMWERIYGEFMPQSAYRQSSLPTIEKYIEWDDATDRCHVEIMIPIEG